MSECGEDLLVDLSEILFNELAFFRLMQNLDTSNTKVKEKLRTFAKVINLLPILTKQEESKMLSCRLSPLKAFRAKQSNAVVSELQFFAGLSLFFNQFFDIIFLLVIFIM